jgi:hypothetical protein
MRTFSILFAAASVLLLLSSCAPAGSSSAQGHLVFNQQVVWDSQGFDTEVFRMLVPEGWTFSGGVAWDMQKLPPEPTLAYTVSSPDGLSVVEQHRPRRYVWSQDPMFHSAYAQQGNPVVPPMAAGEYLRSVFLTQDRGGVSRLRVIETADLPEMAQTAQAAGEQELQVFHSISPFTFPIETRTDAAWAKIAFEYGGREMIEDVTIVVSSLVTYMRSGFGTVSTVHWGASIRAFRTPADQLSATLPLYQVMTTSHRANPAWSIRNTQFAATITRQQIREQQAIFARMQEMRRSQTEVSDIIADVYRDRDQSQNRIFERYSETIRSVESYHDPINGLQVELPGGHSSAWTNGSVYVFSDDATYNPNIGSTQNWERMQQNR